MELAEAKILITGGGGGIGRFLTNGLVAKAKKVFILDVDEDLLKQVPDHPQLRKYKCDVTNDEELKMTIGKIFYDEGGVNVLINNAGVIHNEPLINMINRPDRKHNMENWNKVIHLNLTSVFRVTSHIVDQMVTQREQGVIINISSISAEGNIGQSAYSASKAGIEALTKTWSKELAMFKIRSVCIAPGFFDTPSTRKSLSESMLSKWSKAVPVSRLGELGELLSAAEFLINNEYYNGRVLKLDGGLKI